MPEDTPARSVDDVAVKGIAAKVQEVFAADGQFLSFPLAPVAYRTEDLDFLSPDGLTANQLATLAELSELVNRLPRVSQVWATDAADRHLWDVYADVLGAELATSERTTAEEQAYQRAYGYLHTFAPEPPDPPSQVVLDYQAAQAAYLAAESAWRNGKDGPQAAELAGAKDQAWQAWRDTGHKDEVEEARLTAATLADKDPSVTWSRYRAQFDPGMPASFQTSPTGNRFVPSGFAPSAALEVPWPRMVMDRPELDAAAGSAAPELAAALHDSPTVGSVTSVAFDFMAVDVTRPWFESAMLTSRAWRFRPGGEALSDGAEPPQGRCPAYVTKLVLARNIAVTRTRSVAGDPPGRGALAFIEPALTQLVIESPPVVVEQPPPEHPDWTIRAKVLRHAVSADEHMQLFTRARAEDAPALRIARFAPLMASEAVTGPGPEPELSVSQRRVPMKGQLAVRAMDRIQRFDFPVQQVLQPVETPPAPAPSPEDEVTVTAPDVVFVMAFACKVLGATPAPDPGLPWPG